MQFNCANQKCQKSFERPPSQVPPSEEPCCSKKCYFDLAYPDRFSKAKKIKELREKKHLPFPEIGGQLGLTAERVRRIYIDYHQPKPKRSKSE